ncbi:hypothetical protein [Cellulomonas phragmiteti]|uniref:hypothetical protein n=1 Tax=Cellulomonas phragmiteti TaxID=478780 RepID=UPI001943DF3F|nr:hypothetical protein [Cellulomonas phragmiteti]
MGPERSAVERRARWWVEPVVSSALTAAGLAAVWLLAVPREAVCPAIYPPPAGCTTADRVGTATAWTLALVAVWAVTLATARLRGRTIPSLLVAVTIVLCLAAYVGTLYSTGFVLGQAPGAPTLGT